MPRRRELADVADGISGHFMFDSPANPDWPLAWVARAVRVGDGTSFSFDLVSGKADPPSKHVESVSKMLQHDLARHLAARRLPLSWVRDASLDVRVGDWSPGRVALVRCQVRIVDDRETVHTSTRRGQTTVPRGSLVMRLREWFHRVSSSEPTMRISIPTSIAYPVVHFDQSVYPLIARNPQELSEAYEDGMWDEIESAFDADNMRYDVEVEYPVSVTFVPREIDFDGFLSRLRRAVKQHINQGRFRSRRPTAEQQEKVDSMSFDELFRWISERLGS